MSKHNKNLIRIRLVDWMSFWLTLGLVIILAAAMAVIHSLGWDEGIVGSVISILIALFFCTLVVDLAMLLTACITVADGTVNAGKDAEGQVMIFHADKVERIELRDKAANVLPEDKKHYRRVYLTFVMESGRTNQREMNTVTQKQLDKIRAAITQASKKL